MSCKIFVRMEFASETVAYGLLSPHFPSNIPVSMGSQGSLSTPYMIWDSVVYILAVLSRNKAFINSL